MPKTDSRDRPWWRRRSFLDVRNGRLVVLAAISLIVGTGTTLLTAYLGIR